MAVCTALAGPDPRPPRVPTPAQLTLEQLAQRSHLKRPELDMVREIEHGTVSRSRSLQYLLTVFSVAADGSLSSISRTFAAPATTMLAQTACDSET